LFLLALIATLMCTSGFVNAQEEDEESAEDLDNVKERVGGNNEGVHDSDVGEILEEDENEDEPSQPAGAGATDSEEDLDNDDNDPLLDPEGDDSTDEVVASEVISYEAQKSKSKLCLFIARANAQPSSEFAKQMVEAYISQSEGQLDEGKAFELIMVHTFSRCYKKTPMEIIDKITKEGLSPEEEPMKSLIEANGLDKPLNPRAEQLSKEEWEVVNEVLEEEKKQQQPPPKQQKQQRKAQEKRQFKQANSDIFGLPGISMGTTTSFMYMIAVIGIIISGALFVLRKLSSEGSAPGASYAKAASSKAAKKAEQKAAKLEKKKLA